MAPSATRKRTILAPILAGPLVGAAVALPALAATSTKFYTPSISPTSSSPGATVSYTFKTLNNTTSSQQLGSANISVPSGFTVGTPISMPHTFNSSDDSSAGKTWTAGLNTSGTTIMLRNPGPGPANRLNPGHYVAVVFRATAPCTTGLSTWITRVKQSNDFSGTGNDFTRTGTDPQVNVMAGGGGGKLPLSSQFTGQPTDTQVNHIIDPAVQVTVTDACNNPESAIAVTMSLATNPGG